MLCVRCEGLFRLWEETSFPCDGVWRHSKTKTLAVLENLVPPHESCRYLLYSSPPAQCIACHRYGAFMTEALWSSSPYLSVSLTHLGDFHYHAT